MMGPGQNFLTWVGPGRVRNLWFGFDFGKFPLKMSNFSIFFALGQKNIFALGQKVPGSKAGRPLIYCGSKVSSGPVRAVSRIYIGFIYFDMLNVVKRKLS